MIGRLDRLLTRPVGERERRRAFLIVALVLVVATVGLSLARERQHASPRAITSGTVATQPPTPPAPTSAPAPPASIPTPDGGQLSGAAPAGAMAAGRMFLVAYLRFSYGQIPPRFPDASPALAAQLERFHVEVGPMLRARRLSLLALRAGPRAGGFEVGALASPVFRG